MSDKIKVLITGITGMIGSHLTTLLLKKGFSVAGISSATSASRYLSDNRSFKHFKGDIMDKNFLRYVWSNVQPDLVFHLAGQAYNGESWRAEETTYHLNVKGSRNVFEVCKELSPNSRIIPACSSAEYGIVKQELFPICEDITPLRPISPYGVSKSAMEMMARQFHLNYQMDFVLPRLFIHLGPDHPPVTAIQNFARQLAAIKLGLQEPVMKVGNLETSRDFVDVRDGVKALDILADRGVPGEVYNICTGTAFSIRDALDTLIKLSDVNVNVEIDASLFRPSDEIMLVGNPSKMDALGWSPTVPFKKTLSDILNNWIKRLQVSRH